MYFSMHGPLHTLVMQVHVLVYIRNIQPVVPVLYFVCLAFRRLGDVAKYVTRPSLQPASAAQAHEIDAEGKVS